MTCIANYPTKKAFKQAVADNKNVVIEDPSIFAPYYGTLKNFGKRCVVTNHPKRSWFAEVKFVGDKIIVT